jgi:hypothetical protein
MNWCLASIWTLAWFDNIDVLVRNNLNIIGSTDWNNSGIRLLQRSMEYFMTSEIDQHQAFLSISYNKLRKDFFTRF